MLNHRDWETACAEYQASNRPFKSMIVDDVLVPARAEQLRLSLLSYWSWRRKDPSSEHLHAFLGKHALASELQLELSNVLSCFVRPNKRSQPTALLYTADTVGKIHYDGHGVAMTIWLTEDHHNLTPKSGGLLLYQTRIENGSRAARTSADFVEELLRKHRGTIPLETEIPYRYNRMVLFDAAIVHQTAPFRFSHDCPEGHRLNLSYVFDRDQGDFNVV